MKHTILSFLLAAAICLAACTGPGGGPMPRSIDSLAEADPDSALSLLRPMSRQTASWPEADRMRYTLAVLKATAYSYGPMPGDSVADALLDHYTSGGDKRLLPSAYYYAGKIYRANNQIVKAAECFLNAAKASAGQGDHVTEANAWSQLGYMYSNSDMYDKAIQMFKRASSAAKISTDTSDLIFSLRDIGRNYADKNTLDSALHFYKAALAVASKQRNAGMAANIHTQLAALYNKVELPDSAWAHLRPALEYNDPKNQSVLYVLSAKLYNKKEMTDSALFYYKLLTDIGNIYAKHSAHVWLASYYADHGDAMLAVSHLRLSEQYADSLAKARAAETLNAEVKDFETAGLKEENARLKKDIATLKPAAFILALLAAAATACAIIWRRKTKAPATTDEPAGATPPPADHAGRLMALKKSLIYKAIAQKLAESPEAATLSNAEWAELAETEERISPGFLNRLDALCDMSKADRRICLLLRTDFPLGDVAALSCLTRQGLASARTKLYERAFGKKAAASAWDEVVKEL